MPKNANIERINKNQSDPELILPTRNLLPYRFLRLIIQNIGIRSFSQYNNWYDSFKPRWAPAQPHFVYKNKGWQNWNHFTGSNNEFAPYPKGWNRPPTPDGKYRQNYLPYYEAIRLLKPLKIRNRDVYMKMWKNNELPDRLPKWPYRHYTSTGEWGGWAAFLSHSATETVITNQNEERVYAILPTDSINWVRFVIITITKAKEIEVLGKWKYEEELLEDWQSIQSRLVNDNGLVYIGDKLNEFLFYFNNHYLMA